MNWKQECLHTVYAGSSVNIAPQLISCIFLWPLLPQAQRTQLRELTEQNVGEESLKCESMSYRGHGKITHGVEAFENFPLEPKALEMSAGKHELG